MASHNGEIDYKPHPDPSPAGPSTSKNNPHDSSDLGQEGPKASRPGSGSGSGPAPAPASGFTEDIEMDEIEQMRERERLLTGENTPNRLEGKLTSSPTSNSTSTEPISAYNRKVSSFTSLGNIDDAYLSSDDEAASAALLKGRRKDRTSWFTAPAVHGKRGKKYKPAKVSKIAVCIGITGGITVLVSLIVGGGVMVLGRKPVAKSEGWYPTCEFFQVYRYNSIFTNTNSGDTVQGGILSNSPSWEESYAKAQKLVFQLSLPAKVNLTTGHRVSA